MIRKLILIEVILISIFAINTFAQQSGIGLYNVERVGLSGWQFLKIDGSARQAAMGGAYTAISNGNSEAIFGNPSGLVNVNNYDVFFSKVSWIADISHQSVALAKNFNRFGVIGISAVSLDYGEIEETINAPITGVEATKVVLTGATYTAGDIAAGLSYAKNITNRLSIGLNLRYLREQIADVHMQNISIDFGTTYYTGFRSLRFAMVARNIGGDQNLVGWSEEYQTRAVDVRMPLDYRLGVAIDFFEKKSNPHFITAVIEGVHPNDGPERANIGLEYWYNNVFAIRTGYRINYDEESFTFGGGLKTRGLRINYAYVDFGRLKQVHMFSLGFSL